MHWYKRIIKCKNYTEVEVYSCFREVGKNYGGRGVNRSLTSEKQKAANAIRNTKKWSRIIDCNFDEQDYWCRFSAPYGTFCDEKSFLRCINSFFQRIKRRTSKLGVAFKYIGFRECGVNGKNWHMHIVLSREVFEIIQKDKLWKWPNGGINITPLYTDGEFEKLAAYIRKDIKGDKRLMASRNLERPVVTVKKVTRRQLKQLEKNMTMEPPKGFYLSKDEQFKEINDVTGAKYYFKFRKLKR